MGRSRTWGGKALFRCLRPKPKALLHTSALSIHHLAPTITLGSAVHGVTHTKVTMSPFLPSHKSFWDARTSLNIAAGRRAPCATPRAAAPARAPAAAAPARAARFVGACVHTYVRTYVFTYVLMTPNLGRGRRAPPNRPKSGAPDSVRRGAPADTRAPRARETPQNASMGTIFLSPPPPLLPSAVQFALARQKRLKRA
jgi:hypothetical protein